MSKTRTYRGPFRCTVIIETDDEGNVEYTATNGTAAFTADTEADAVSALLEHLGLV